MHTYLAFYKGKGTIVDKAIRWWTKSLHSHVELVVSGMWYSTSPRDKEVRVKNIHHNPGHWDLVPVGIEVERFMTIWDNTKGAKYDWLGILLSQVATTNVHSKDRYFCSEWCAMVMGYKNSNKYSPGDLYRKVTGE